MYCTAHLRRARRCRKGRGKGLCLFSFCVLIKCFFRRQRYNGVEDFAKENHYTFYTKMNMALQVFNIQKIIQWRAIFTHFTHRVCCLICLIMGEFGGKGTKNAISSKKWRFSKSSPDGRQNRGHRLLCRRFFRAVGCGYWPDCWRKHLPQTGYRGGPDRFSVGHRFGIQNL